MISSVCVADLAVGSAGPARALAAGGGAQRRPEEETLLRRGAAAQPQAPHPGRADGN